MAFEGYVYNKLLRGGGDGDTNPLLNTQRDADGRRTAGGGGESSGSVVRGSRVVVLAIACGCVPPGLLLLAELVRDSVCLRIGLVARKEVSNGLQKKEGSGNSLRAIHARFAAPDDHIPDLAAPVGERSLHLQRGFRDATNPVDGAGGRLVQRGGEFGWDAALINKSGSVRKRKERTLNLGSQARSLTGSHGETLDKGDQHLQLWVRAGGGGHSLREIGHGGNRKKVLLRQLRSERFIRH